MSRILLGGFGIALGLLSRPALAQPAPLDPPKRAAAFGQPTALPDPQATPPADPEITPAGLLNRNGPPRRTSLAPGTFGTPTPVIAQPPIPGLVPGTTTRPLTIPMPSTSGQTMPPPRPIPGAPPMVTESRDPISRLPGVLVPSCGPEGYHCPVPCVEEPLFGGLPGRRAIDRLRPGDQAWATAELLLWWTRSSQVPPLVTTSSPQFNGVPGLGDTQTLLGGTFSDSFHVGARLGFGFWFGENQCRGVEARLFFLSPSQSDFTASVPPFPLLGRPFFNVNPNTPGIGFGPAAEVVAGPGVATGAVSAVMETTVWGAEVNYRRFLCGDPCRRIDFLAGYRYLGVNEKLTITETFARVPGSDMTIGTPAQFGVITDQFRTQNSFHGGQIGLAGEWRCGRWFLDSRASVAFGCVNQSVDISGSQVLMFPNGQTAVVPGGLLAVPGANIGNFEQNKFAVVPEVGVNLGYHLTQNFRVFIGYNFLYLSSVLRPGEAIDPRIDAARVPNLLPPGTAPIAVVRPLPQLSTSGFFVQGINFGLTYRW